MATSKASAPEISISEAITLIESRDSSLDELQKLWKKCKGDKRFRARLANATGWSDFYLQVLICGKIADLEFQRDQMMGRPRHRKY